MGVTVAEQVPRRVSLAWPELPLGIGTSRLCSLNGGLSVRRAARLVSQAVELGVRFIDTAPTYGQGQAESAIGRLAPVARDQLLICSKVGYSFGRRAHLINAAKPLLRPVLPWATAIGRTIASARDRAERSGKMSLRIDPTAIRSVLEGSLRRMRRDYLDLLLLHDPSRESVDSTAVQEELDRLVESGRIRAWGVSTGDPDVAKRATQATGCSVVQVPVNPDWVDENLKMLQKCAEHGIVVIANSVLSPLSQQPTGGTTCHRFTTVEQCLAFALRQPAVRLVLCGTRKLNHLRQNVGIVRRLLPECKARSC